jgi:hypothetical protein
MATITIYVEKENIIRLNNRGKPYQNFIISYSEKNFQILLSTNHTVIKL